MMVSEGIAKPRPCELVTLAVVIPTTCPLAFRRGPPELPGFMGALNWITFAMEKFPEVSSWIVRPSWLTIPWVMDPVSP